MQQFIFNEEMAEARAPRPGGIAIGMAGPTLITIGTEEQQAEHLPPILSGEAIWCQGYSEPGSGSDLASLQTRAVKDGDDWVVNGQKIWTSGAHRADWMILLARTDPDAPKHKGITYFMLDMHSPGVEVRPLVNMTNTHEFNEVFFEDVRIPSRHILGEVNRGWYGAVTTLDFERSSIGSAVGMRQGVEAIIDVAKEYRGSGRSSLGENEATRNALADRYIEAQTAMMISYRIVSMQSQGMIPNHEASMAKLYAMELNQRIQGTAMKVLGLYGQLGGEIPTRRSGAAISTASCARWRTRSRAGRARFSGTSSRRGGWVCRGGSLACLRTAPTRCDAHERGLPHAHHSYTTNRACEPGAWRGAAARPGRLGRRR